MSGETRARAVPEAAIWQDVEFGAYTADLPLWDELAAEAEASIVEIGAGSGRVTLHLARTGRQVIPLDRDGDLIDELRRRAAAADVLVAPLAVDVTLPESLVRAVTDAGGPSLPGLVIAPLHAIQQIDPEARPRVLESIARMLRPGGVFAAVIVDESSLREGDGMPDPDDPLPDMREIDGCVYSSEPLWVQVGEREMRIRRLRQRVSPDGDIERSVHDEHLHRLEPDALEREARAAGLSPAGRRPIASGPAEADSIAVLLEVPR